MGRSGFPKLRGSATSSKWSANFGDCTAIITFLHACSTWRRNAALALQRIRKSIGSVYETIARQGVGVTMWEGDMHVSS